MDEMNELEQLLEEEIMLMYWTNPNRASGPIDVGHTVELCHTLIEVLRAVAAEHPEAVTATLRALRAPATRERVERVMRAVQADIDLYYSA